MTTTPAPRLLTDARSKYGARQTTIDGFFFASAAEARRYSELRLMQQEGLITGLTLQPKFELLAGFRDPNHGFQRPVRYTADFRYVELPVQPGQRMIVEEVKGFETEAWKIRKRLFLEKFGHLYELRIIKA